MVVSAIGAGEVPESTDTTPVEGKASTMGAPSQSMLVNSTSVTSARVTSVSGRVRLMMPV